MSGWPEPCKSCTVFLQTGKLLDEVTALTGFPGVERKFAQKFSWVASTERLAITIYIYPFHVCVQDVDRTESCAVFASRKPRIVSLHSHHMRQLATHIYIKRACRTRTGTLLWLRHNCPKTSSRHHVMCATHIYIIRACRMWTGTLLWLRHNCPKTSLCYHVMCATHVFISCVRAGRGLGVCCDCITGAQRVCGSGWQGERG